MFNSTARDKTKNVHGITESVIFCTIILMKLTKERTALKVGAARLCTARLKNYRSPTDHILNIKQAQSRLWGSAKQGV